MELKPELAAEVAKAKQAKGTKDVASRSLACLDLTSLKKDDTDETITDLCKRADQGQLGRTAAVCVYPRFLRTAFNETAGSDIKLATVVSFPTGKASLLDVFETVRGAKKDGANEVDIVIDYDAINKGDEARTAYSAAALELCKETCGNTAKMKVILESSAYDDAEKLYKAAKIALDEGADYLKTSTGKHEKGGATLEAAAIMLQAIKDSGRTDVGLKISGGVKTVDDCAQYIALAENMMGEGWATPDNFRFGASSVLKSLVACLKGETPPAPSAPGNY